MSRRSRNRYRDFDQGRKNGWGIGLYRHPSDSWLGGVCAGLADYWDVPTWVTRLSVFALFCSQALPHFGSMSRRGFSSASVHLDGMMTPLRRT